MVDAPLGTVLGYVCMQLVLVLFLPICRRKLLNSWGRKGSRAHVLLYESLCGTTFTCKIDIESLLFGYIIRGRIKQKNTYRLRNKHPRSIKLLKR